MDINDIVKGGDERITLNENGLNKYHGNPLIYESVFNRGSCTMSNLNVDSKRAVDKMLKKLEKEDIWTKKQEKELAELEDFISRLNETKGKMVLKSEIRRMNEEVQKNEKKLPCVAL